MIKVIWQPAARRDRADIFNHILADNPKAAARMDELFSLAARRLMQFPEMGRPGAIAGTRELIAHKNYRIVYRISESAIRIMPVVHTSRQWPPVRDD